MSGIEAAFFGALGRDAESKVSKAGKPYLRLNIRVGDGDGAQWVSAMVFDQSAIDAASEWSGQDGVKRHGLSLMSWHCRLSQIGRNRPPRAARDQGEARQ
jgi:hypothetical protein